MSIDLASGRRVASSSADHGNREVWGNAEPEFGNLLALGNRVISAGPQGVTSFLTAEKALDTTEERLAQAGSFPPTLLTRAKVNLGVGRHSKALAYVTAALAANPEPALREELRSVRHQILLDVLSGRAGEQSLKVAPAAGLEMSKQQRVEYLQAMVSHLRREGRFVDALRTARELADGAGREFVRVPETVGLRVRADRWLLGIVRDMFDAVSPEQRAALAAGIARREAAGWDATEESLRAFLAIYGAVPEAGRQWLALAVMLAGKDTWPEAEIIYLRLQEHVQPEIAAEASLGLARLYARLDLHESTRWLCAGVQEQFPKLKLPGGQTTSAVASGILDSLPEPERPASLASSIPSEFTSERQILKTFNRRRRPMAAIKTPLPSFRGTVVSWDYRTYSLECEWRDTKWSVPFERRSNPAPSDRILFRGYHGNSVFSLGSLFFAAAQNYLVGGSSLAKGARWVRKPEDDWQTWDQDAFPLLRRLYPIAQPLGDTLVSCSGASQYRYARPMDICPDALLVLGGNGHLVALDPLDGSLIWHRPVQVPAYSHFHIVKGQLYESHQGYRLKIYRMTDGRQVKETELPESFHGAGIWARHDHFSADLEDGTVTIKLHNALSQEQTWGTTTPKGSLYLVASPTEWGTVDPAGRFRLFDLGRKKKTLDATFPAFKERPSNLYGWVQPDAVFLLAPIGRGADLSESAQYMKAMNANLPTRFSVAGTLYCFDRPSSKFRWKRELGRDPWWLYNTTYPHSPFVLLARPGEAEPAAEGERPDIWAQDGLHVLDAHTGKTLHQEGIQKTNRLNEIEERDGEIALQFSRATLTIRYKMRPREPAE